MSDYGDIETNPCAALDAAVASNALVLSDDMDDFYDGSPCNLGRYLADSVEIAGNSYKLLVINAGTDCVGWITKPADPIYDSSVLAPWMEMATQEVAVDSGSCVVFDGTKVLSTITPPYFSVATKLMVFWTVLFHGTSGSDQCKWHPHWGDVEVDGGGGTPVVSDIFVDNPTAGQWCVSTFSAVLDHPAGESDKVISAIVNGTVGSIRAIVCVYAVAA